MRASNRLPDLRLDLPPPLGPFLIGIWAPKFARRQPNCNLSVPCPEQAGKPAPPVSYQPGPLGPLQDLGESPPGNSPRWANSLPRPLALTVNSQSTGSHRNLANNRLESIGQVGPASSLGPAETPPKRRRKRRRSSSPSGESDDLKRTSAAGEPALSLANLISLNLRLNPALSRIERHAFARLTSLNTL